MENEAPQHTFGPHPKGYLIITLEGRLMIMITADNRKAGMGDAERAALHKTMAAASGKVRVEGKDFIISVDVSWNEAWNGTVRWLRFFEQIFCVVKWKLLPGLGQRGSACKLTRAAARYAATQRGSEA